MFVFYVFIMIQLFKQKVEWRDGDNTNTLFYFVDLVRFLNIAQTTMSVVWIIFWYIQAQLFIQKVL